MRNKHVFDKQRGQINQYSNEQWKAPFIYLKYTLKSLVKGKDELTPELSELCQEVDPDEFYMKNPALDARDAAALNTIFSKGSGCVQCPTKQLEGQTPPR